MQHLTMKDYLALNDAQDEAYATEMQAHLETCEQCAALYNIQFSPVRMGEPADDLGEPCAYCDDVYELFRNRLPLERFVPLMSHLMQCEKCDGFFDLLLTREAPSSQAKRAAELLESARGALANAGFAHAEMAVCQVTNLYAYAASGDGFVIEATGELANGAPFTIAYDPNLTVFRVATASIGQTVLRRHVDNRLIEGWSETENGQSGCSLPSNGVGILHVSEPDDAVGKLILIMPYSKLCPPTGDNDAQ